MFLLVGLGNPGSRYKDTRHNVGFMVLDEVSRIAGIKVRGFRYKGRTGSGAHKGQKLFLLKPRTYMNLSGESVKAAMRGLRIKPDKIIVIYDDMDLPLGRIRVRAGGSDGGHKGMRSIIERLGTRDIARVRVGIGKPDRDGGSVGHVLDAFTNEERKTIEQAIEIGANAALAIMDRGVTAAMNEFNSK